MYILFGKRECPWDSWDPMLMGNATERPWDSCILPHTHKHKYTLFRQIIMKSKRMPFSCLNLKSEIQSARLVSDRIRHTKVWAVVEDKIQTN